MRSCEAAVLAVIETKPRLWSRQRLGKMHRETRHQPTEEGRLSRLRDDGDPETEMEFHSAGKAQAM